MLKVVNKIKEFGLDYVIDFYKLKHKIANNLVLLKYDQINSSYEHEEVRECRGLILELNTWKIVSYPFYKFFNIQESYAAKIDWDSVKVLKKLDGTLITLYYYNNEWLVSTTSMPLAEGAVNNRPESKFSLLFWETFKICNNKNNLSIDELKNNLNKNYCYMFELMTPYNIVVKQHMSSSIELIGMRNMITLDEVKYDDLAYFSDEIGIKLVDLYDFKNLNDINETLINLPYEEEGYVLVDKYNNRVKVKNPAYVAMHYFKGSKVNHNIISIIRSNEIDEYIGLFPERKDEILKLKDNYNNILNNIKNIVNNLKYLENLSIKDRAEEIKKIRDNKIPFLSSYLFAYFNKNMSIEDFLNYYNDKKLYEILK